MKLVERYEDLAPLLSAQLRRGVVTNAALTAEDWRREIANRALWAHSWEGGLLLLRRREDRALLSFYLRELAIPDGLTWDGPTVMEIAARPRDEGPPRAVDFWVEQGFEVLLRRERMVLPKGVKIPLGDSPLTPRTAVPEDLDRIWAMLRAHYDPLTGCVPTREELARDVAEGRVLCADAPDGRIAGIQRFVLGPGRVQPQHLAIDPAYRRQGGAQLLMAFCAEQADRPRNVLWVNTNNASARRLYDKIGYVPDGWGSTVLYRP